MQTPKQQQRQQQQQQLSQQQQYQQHDEEQRGKQELGREQVQQQDQPQDGTSSMQPQPSLPPTLVPEPPPVLPASDPTAQCSPAGSSIPPGAGRASPLSSAAATAADVVRMARWLNAAAADGSQAADMNWGALLAAAAGAERGGSGVPGWFDAAALGRCVRPMERSTLQSSGHSNPELKLCGCAGVRLWVQVGGECVSAKGPFASGQAWRGVPLLGGLLGADP